MPVAGARRGVNPFFSPDGQWLGYLDGARVLKVPLAGGALLAFSLIVGSVIGVLRGQPSLGFIGGLGVGLVLLVAVALIDRARSR